MKISVSQKTWPRYASPESDRAPTEQRGSAGFAAAIRWKSAKRRARSRLGAPSMITEARCQRSAQAASCRATSLESGSPATAPRSRTAASSGSATSRDV